MASTKWCLAKILANGRRELAGECWQITQLHQRADAHRSPGFLARHLEMSTPGMN